MSRINMEENFGNSSQQASMPPFQVSPHGIVEVWREESRSSVMMGGSSSTIHENSTLVATDVAAIAVVNSAIKAGDQGISKKAGDKGKI